MYNMVLTVRLLVLSQDFRGLASPIPPPFTEKPLAMAMNS